MRHKTPCCSVGGRFLVATGKTLDGSDPQDFQVVSATLTGSSLANGQCAGFSATFTPTQAGPRSATLSFHTNVGDVVFALIGTGGGATLTLDKITIAQVTYDPSLNNDGVIDLVSGKPTVVIVTVSATGASAADSSLVTFEVALCRQKVPLTATDPSQLSLGEFAILTTQEVKFYFTPIVSNQCELMVTVDPDNLITEPNPHRLPPPGV
jgi:hypothetical protein